MKSIQSHQTYWLTSLALLLFLLLAPSTVNGQTNSGIELDVKAGLDGWYKQGGWIRVQIEASNAGPSIEGSISTRFPIGDALYSVPISLATQSNKKVELYIYAQGLVNTIEIVLRDSSGEIIAEAGSSVISTLPQDSLLYGVVSSQTDTLGLLSNVDAGRSDVGVAYIDVDDLPVNPAGWAPLDVLVFSDVDTNQLSLPQRTAIEQWVQLGGQLVLTGGAAWQKSTAVFEDLLPVTVNGSQSIDTLPQFEAEIGEPFRDPGPYVVATSSLRDGEIIFREEGLPLLSRRSHGQGNVYFLAFDPQFAPLDDWDGSEGVWQTVAERVDPPVMWAQGFIDNSSVFDSVSTIPSLSLPSIWLVLGFMAAYIFLVGPVNYILLNRYNRRELAWLTIPVSILLFSGVAFVVGLQFKGNRVILNEVSVVSGQAGGPAVYNTAVGVYSPGRSSFNLDLAGETLTHPLNRLGFTGTPDGVDIVYGPSTTVSDFLVNVGEVFPVSTLRIEGESGFEGEVVLANDGATGQLRLINQTDGAINNATLLVGAGSILLGEIAPGETIEREINIPSGFRDAFLDAARFGVRDYRLTTPVSGGTYIESPLEPYYVNILADEGNAIFVEYDIYDDPNTYQRFQLLQGLYDQYGSTELYTPLTSVTLIGWSETSTIEAEINTSRVDRSAETLYFIDLPLQVR